MVRPKFDLGLCKEACVELRLVVFLLWLLTPSRKENQCLHVTCIR